MFLNSLKNLPLPARAIPTESSLKNLSTLLETVLPPITLATDVSATLATTVDIPFCIPVALINLLAYSKPTVSTKTARAACASLLARSVMFVSSNSNSPVASLKVTDSNSSCLKSLNT